MKRPETKTGRFFVPFWTHQKDNALTDLSSQITSVHERFAESLSVARDVKDLDSIRVAYLGRSGELTAMRRRIGLLPVEERRTVGSLINEAATRMEEALHDAGRRVEAGSLLEALGERIDVTFPGLHPAVGATHPVRQTMADLCSFFERRGFAIVLGPEIEPEYYNFDALNIPRDHPAREGFDSFFITDTLLLRPHTSPMQIRTMERFQPPIAVVVPGRCYRRDAVDSRHLFMFHQIEGLLVDDNIHMGHLKGILTAMCADAFGREQALRFRPSFFPFTEPSAEVDTTCPACQGNGGECRTCGGSGWIELGGAGMVHPNVLREVGYDPAVVSGWAFGFGIERIALARYGVDDIRLFYENDPAFLEQFS